MIVIIDGKKNLLNFKLNEGYSAPEQHDKGKISTYTDVYSLAAVMYKSLTGTKPVNSKSRLANDNLLPPNILNPYIPKNISLAIMSALALSPKFRTQTMKDFYEDIITPAREEKANHLSQKPNKKTNLIKKTNKKDAKIKKTKTKKETTTKKLIFFSLLISCSILSFFLVIIIFLIFNEDFF